jgi:heme-degrading monooxygenase HmoA
MSQILKNLPIGSYAVIFPTISSGQDEEGHEKLLSKLYVSAQQVSGYLGLESAQIGDFKISIAYYKNKKSIDTWRKNTAHIAAKNKAKSTWLKDWQIRICKIEDIYGK